MHMHLIIKNILLKCNDFTKKMSIIFLVIEYIIYYMDFTSIHRIDSFVRFLISACVHGITGLCAVCILAKQSTIIACTHTWIKFSDPSMIGVACDFSLPPHAAATTASAITHICSICHAVACSGCYVG